MPPEVLAATDNRVGVTWGQILEQWANVSNDLHEVYGIDVDRDLLAVKPWPWLRMRVLGLLTTSSRTQRVLMPNRPRGSDGARPR